eukprot:CAMPEP_0184675100 /NCGR_PEP_ID=MMETSP0308-20130426/87606_1 /TAXON_ID=38269 /ORGANISM="Gloeochaete witrockiana, Strain SAG 46.84" /LENGTH=40 /DNA_ID= /DNA_START= /DNA_END= /DNA_ORIENTATION=
MVHPSSTISDILLDAEFQGVPEGRLGAYTFLEAGADCLLT